MSARYVYQYASRYRGRVRDLRSCRRRNRKLGPLEVACARCGRKVGGVHAEGCPVKRWGGK